MKRAVFFDIDGTILDTRHGKLTMTPAVSEAILRLQQEGNLVFIATGRPKSFITDYLMNFGFDGFLLNNGAHIMMNGETIHKEPLEKGFVSMVTEALDRMNIQYILQGEQYSYLKKEFSTFENFFGSVGIKGEKIKREFDMSEIDVLKIEVLCASKEDSTYCTELVDAYPEYDYFFSVSQRLCEIHAKKNNKGTGILKILELLNIPLEESFAFGDGANDKEMLETVGCGIAMGNASDEVKTYADKVTDAVDEDGVAKGIYAYILNEDGKIEELCS